MNITMTPQKNRSAVLKTKTDVSLAGAASCACARPGRSADATARAGRSRMRRMVRRALRRRGKNDPYAAPPPTKQSRPPGRAAGADGPAIRMRAASAPSVDHLAMEAEIEPVDLDFLRDAKPDRALERDEDQERDESRPDDRRERADKLRPHLEPIAVKKAAPGGIDRRGR